MKNKLANLLVNIVKRGDNQLPTYAHPSDAGFDLRADFSNPDNITAHNCDWDSERQTFIMFSGGRAAIPTGIKVRIPDGYELQIRSRSGLAIKQGVFTLNSPGTIDAGYTGEICVILCNLSDEPFEIKQGDKIAQAVLNKIEQIEWNIVDSLEETDRGEKGFGSTGINEQN